MICLFEKLVLFFITRAAKYKKRKKFAKKSCYSIFIRTFLRYGFTIRNLDSNCIFCKKHLELQLLRLRDQQFESNPDLQR